MLVTQDVGRRTTRKTWSARRNERRNRETLADPDGGGAIMRTRIIPRLLAWAIVQVLLTAGTGTANTVDLVHNGFGASEAATVWGGGTYGDEVGAGVYLLNKTGSSGAGDTWRNGPVGGFCVELNEAAPTATTRYTVGMPEDMTVSYTGAVLGTTKANYLRELWAGYFNPEWFVGGSETHYNREAAAFAAAVWEIVYEDVPSAANRWDVTADGTSGLGGFIALNVDADMANRWLQGLDGTGVKADLRVFTANGAQNYLVAVPEPATMLLLGLGGLCSVLGRRPFH
jgi:hypothetical protein